MKLTRIILSLVIFACALTGCTKNEQPEVVEAVEEEARPQIGMSFDSFVTERWLRDQEAFVSTAKELGADVNVQSANSDVNEQISQIEYFIEKQMDVIVIIAADASSFSDVIAKAKKAGIKVVCYDRLCLNSDADLYISFDNEQVGTLMAEALLSDKPRGCKVITVCGPEADYNVESVGKGFENTCRKFDAQIIGGCSCDGWRSEQAYDFVNDNTELVSEADAIMCGNDDLAGAVIRALSENRLLEDIPIVGQDADLNACQRIVEEKQLMTVYKPVEKLARTAAECAVKMAKNEELNVSDTFSDGTYDVPYIKLEPIPVTKENMDDVIVSGGFHSKDEIYLNVTN